MQRTWIKTSTRIFLGIPQNFLKNSEANAFQRAIVSPRDDSCYTASRNNPNAMPSRRPRMMKRARSGELHFTARCAVARLAVLAV